MNKKSLFDYFTKINIIVSWFLMVFIYVFLFYFPYKDYSNNIKSLEKNNYEKYCEIIKKTNKTIVNQYKFGYQKTEKELKKRLKKRVFLAFALVQSIYYESNDKNTAKKLLNLIRYDNGKTCYYIIDFSGRIVLNPPDKNIEGKLVNELEKGNTRDKFAELFDFYKNNYQGYLKITESYDSYGTIKSAKLYFGFRFDQYKWIILIGEFIRDSIRNFKNNFIENLKFQEIPENNFLILVNKSKKILHISQPIQNSDYVIGKLLEQNRNNHFRVLGHYTYYISSVPNSECYVISGFDNNKIKKEILALKNKIYKRFLTEIVFITMVLFFIFFFSIFFVRKFRKNIQFQFNKFVDFFKKVPEEEIFLNNEEIPFREFTDIGNAANEMVRKISDLNREKEQYLLKIEDERAFLNTILNNLQEGVAVVKKDNLIVEYVNPFGLKIGGYSDKIIGLSLNQIIEDTEKREFLKKIFDSVKNSKKPVFIDTIYFLKMNGETFPVALSVVPIIKENNVVKFLAVFRDITLEHEFKKEVFKLKRAIESAPVSIVITDINANIQYVNPHFCIVTGYSQDEAMGQNPRILRTETNKKLYKNLWETITSGEVWKGEFLNKKKNGEKYWEEAVIAPVFNDKGKIINYVAVKEDITDRKMLYNELIKSKEKAEAANKAKSEFLANMSHEIRTPMNAILGFNQLLMESELNETQKEYLTIIQKSSEKLLGILNDILDLAKLEAGKMNYSDLNFNFKELIRNSFDIFKAKAQEKNIKLTFSSDDEIPDYLVGDSLRISQVINNLLGNALKFTQKGEISLNAELLEIKDEYVIVKISVADTGIGIPEDKLMDIFEAFSQSDGSITRKFGGTGLGLTISRKIVSNYNGEFFVRSEEGKGSVFSFTLKLKIGDNISVSQQKKDDEKEISQKDIFKGKTILIVEDNKFNYQLLSNILNRYGIKSEIAENGYEALDKLAEYSFDLIFMDWHMPKMDGVEALKIIRTFESGCNPDQSDIPDLTEKLKGKHQTVIALTAAAMVQEKTYLKEQGFDGYLSKPIQLKELEKILTEFLYYEKIDFNYKYLENLFEGDSETVATLVDSFKDTFRKTLEEMVKSLEDDDFEKIYMAAHTLKGASGNMQMEKIFQLSLEIEAATKKKDSKKIKELVDALKNMKF